MDFRRRKQRRRTHKKKKHHRKTRHKRHGRHYSKPPDALLNFSPVSSPGPNSPPFTLSPNTPPNTPITKRAKELAALYPDTRTMVLRSKSFNTNNGMTANDFYREFERQFPEANGLRYD